MTALRVSGVTMLLACTTSACGGPIILPATYRSPAISATVVDAATRAPVGDAVVVALWELKRFEGYSGDGGAYYRHSGFLKLVETRTDAAGAFTFPAWGPVRVSRMRLDAIAPLLIVYKRGHGWGTFANVRGGPPQDPEELADGGEVTSRWTGKQLALPPAASMESIAYVVGGIYDFDFDRDPCAWEHVPVLTAQLLELRASLDSPPDSGLPFPQKLHFGGKCADPRTVVGFDWSTVPGPTPVRLLPPQTDASMERPR